MHIVNKVAGVAKKNRMALIGFLVGLAGGFLYWKFIGCSGGSCPISSSPVASSLWGAVTGGFLLSAFEKDKKQEK